MYRHAEQATAVAIGATVSNGFGWLAQSPILSVISCLLSIAASAAAAALLFREKKLAMERMSELEENQLKNSRLMEQLIQVVATSVQRPSSRGGD